MTENTKLSKTEAIKSFFDSRYNFRFNAITKQTEYKEASGNEYIEVDKPLLNKLRTEMSDSGVIITVNEIRKYLSQHFFDAEKIDKFEKSGTPSDNEQIEMYLLTKYDFRFNTIKCKPEARNLGDKTFNPIDKYYINTTKRELDSVGVKTSTSNIKEILESSFADRVNPIQDYFENLPLHTGVNDYIQDLADTIKTVNNKNWYLYLKKWLIAVVAQAVNDIGCQNHTCLVLTGSQGKFKTTWLDNLCPKDIHTYLFTGKIDPTNKDSLTYIAEFFLVNIDDQLRQLNKKDENELKNLITTPSVKYRRPYDPYITEYPHTASFMASVNGNDFLTDPSGSRRFLPFEVLEIDINKAKSIDMNKVYAQAYKLYKEKTIYWFNDEEIEELHEQNKNFEVVTNEEQLILEYFDIPNKRDEATHYMQLASMQTHVQQFTKINLNTKKFNEARVKLGFDKWLKTENNVKKWVVSVIKKNFPDIENLQKNSN
jgi:predicted P-loop ATPase